jgi:hypothetical protein
MDIQLKFINQSKNTRNAQYVIFQRNAARGADKTLVAWKVLTGLGQGDSHTFALPEAMEVGASRNYREEGSINFFVQLNSVTAEVGGLYSIDAIGDSDGILHQMGYASSASEIQIRNDFHDLDWYGDILKGGGRILTAPLLPGQMAAFALEPTIYIGVSWTARERWVIEESRLSDITALPLLGIRSADIIATGGGPDDERQPVNFGLANVVR